MSHDPTLSVLVVEDESLVLAWIAGWLESKGCIVLGAGAAEAALAYLGNGHAIDAVVTDIRLGDGPTGGMWPRRRERDGRTSVSCTHRGTWSLQGVISPEACS